MRLSEFIPFYMETYVEGRNKPAVQIQKRLMLDRLVALLNDPELAAIDEMKIALLESRLRRQKCGPKTINNHFGCLRNILKWAKKFKHIPVLPEFQPMKVIYEDVRFLTDEEIDLVAGRLEPLWHAAFMFAINTGLRVGELRALQWKHINWKNETVRVIEATSGRYNTIGSTKGKARTVPLCEAARIAIQHIDSGSQFVFARPKRLGTPDAALSYKTFQLGLRRSTKTIRGLDWVGWHSCRHTFASRLVMAGVSLMDVKELLGHVDMATTLRYAHLAPSSLQRAVATLDKPR